MINEELRPRRRHRRHHPRVQGRRIGTGRPRRRLRQVRRALRLADQQRMPRRRPERLARRVLLAHRRGAPQGRPGCGRGRRRARTRRRRRARRGLAPGQEVGRVRQGRRRRRRAAAAADHLPGQRGRGHRALPAVAEVGLPIMAYNNPYRHQGRPHARAGRRARPDSRASSRSRSSPPTSAGCSRSRNAATSTSSPAPTTCCSSRLSPGRPAGSPATPTRSRKRGRRDLHPGQGRQDRRGARALHAAGRRVPLGLQDRVRAGDQALDRHRRQQLRRTDPSAARAAQRPRHEPPAYAPTREKALAVPRAAADAHAEDLERAMTMRSTRRVHRGRLAHRGDADPGHHRRRRRDPGRDDERQATSLHGAAGRHPPVPDERAARACGDERRDPAAADPAGLPTGASSTSRCPDACRCAATAPSGWRRCWSRPAWSRWSSRSRRSGSTPRPASSSPGSPSATGTPTRSRSRTCRRYSVRLDDTVEVPGFGQVVQPGLRRQLLRDGRPRRGRTCPSTAPTSRRSSTAGLAIMDAINATDAAEAPRNRGARPLPPRRVHRAGLDAPTTPGTPWRSTRAGSTARPCGTGTSARMAELWARGELALDTDFVNESFIGSRFIGRLIRRDDGRRASRPSSRPSPGGPGSPASGQYLLDPPTRSRPDFNFDRIRPDRISP